MTRNIIDFDSFSPSEDYDRNEELSIEEALDMLDQASLLEDLLYEEESGEVPGDVASLVAGPGPVADKVRQELGKAALVPTKQNPKPKAMPPKEMFGKATSTILKAVNDPVQAALALRNFYSRFLNQNKVPCNMINIATKKEVRYSDYVKEIQAKAAKGAKAGGPKPTGPAPKPEGK
jgi:hypothetical protein